MTLLRHVESQITLTVLQTADLVFSMAVSREYQPLSEQLTVSVDGIPVEAHEVPAPVKARLHRVPAAPPGRLVLEYAATVVEATSPVGHSEFDAILHGRPSRYCDSDRLAAVAWSHFQGLSGLELVSAIRDWVCSRILYTPGSSRVVDGALETYLSRKGVCRDSAHLVITFCRAMGVPARLVSVYAPGLRPMDFHAVAEVMVEGDWHVVDATGLAPRPSMVRIATGRDASDTAFLTTVSGRQTFGTARVNAIIEGELPEDDGHSLVRLH